MAKLNGIISVKRLSQLAQSKAEAMLKDHVLWKSWTSRDDDILISLTPSFLFALQHAVRKIAISWRTTADNCYVTIIDTSTYPQGTFSWTVDLLNHYGLNETENKNLRHIYHEGEYLAEWELNLIPNTSREVSVRDLIRGGLFDVIPELDDPLYRKSLWLRLHEFREEWYLDSQATRPDDILRAHRLALCYGGQWFIPMMIWALAVRRRPVDDPVLKNEFRDTFFGKVPYPWIFQDKGTTIPDSMQELVEWSALMLQAHKAQEVAKIQSLAQADTENVVKAVDLDKSQTERSESFHMSAVINALPH